MRPCRIIPRQDTIYRGIQKVVFNETYKPCSRFWTKLRLRQQVQNSLRGKH